MEIYWNNLIDFLGNIFTFLWLAVLTWQVITLEKKAGKE